MLTRGGVSKAQHQVRATLQAGQRKGRGQSAGSGGGREARFDKDLCFSIAGRIQPQVMKVSGDRVVAVSGLAGVQVDALVGAKNRFAGESKAAKSVLCSIDRTAQSVE